MPKAPYRILITGSREFSDEDAIEQAILDAIKDVKRPIVIVHGTARGADSIASKIANSLGSKVTEERHPANWRQDGVYNPMAGMNRSREMVELGADICLAFFSFSSLNKGTKATIGYASNAGIPIVVVWDQNEG